MFDAWQQTGLMNWKWMEFSGFLKKTDLVFFRFYLEMILKLCQQFFPSKQLTLADIKRYLSLNLRDVAKRKKAIT